MADSYNKKEREKKRRKRKQEKAEKKERRKEEGAKPAEFMYVDADGNLVPTKPEPRVSDIKAEDIAVSVARSEGISQQDYKRRGKVTHFEEGKGYGFIRDAANGQSYFVHITNAYPELGASDKVIFEIGKGPKGDVAIKVVRDEEAE